MSPQGPSPQDQSLITLDLEGVLTPEIWMAVAEATGVDSFLRTTRDEPDYGLLMAGRLAELDKHEIPFSHLTKIVCDLEPLPGAVEFLDSLRAVSPVVILSDTFEELAAPLLAKLGQPLVLCHSMKVVDDRVVAADVRLAHAKQHAVKAFQSLNYTVTAAGDSFNDIEMLATADSGILFRPSELVKSRHPEFPTVTEFDDLLPLCLGDQAPTED